MPVTLTSGIMPTVPVTNPFTMSRLLVSTNR